MPTVNPTIGQVPLQEAIDHFRGKLNIPSKHWDSMLGEVHAKAFTVAGATKADLLQDLRTAVDDAISKGTTIAEFRKKFDKTVQDHGWAYKGKRGWRTRVIYDTNLRTAHAAGKWQQFQRLKDRRPYGQYLTVGDERVRPQHREWDHKVLPLDAPWWSTHYPPNDWGCRCTMRTLSQRQMEKEGLVVSKAPPIETTERINVASGEVYGKVPKGIGTGWDYNVGKAWLGPDIAFGEKIMAMPKDIRTQALNSAHALAPQLQKQFSPWANSLLDRKQPLGEIKTVGYLSPTVVEQLDKRGHLPSTAVITTTDKDVMHMVRLAKDGKQIPMDMVRSLPDHINKHRAVLWDNKAPGLLYVYDISTDKHADKLVIKVDYATNGSGQTNSLTTRGLANKGDLKKDKRYKVIEGKL